MNSKPNATAVTEATNLLLEYKNSRIADIYESNESVQSALFIVMPDFEYPDHSHKTVAQFLKLKA